MLSSNDSSHLNAITFLGQGRSSDAHSILFHVNKRHYMWFTAQYICHNRIITVCRYCTFKHFSKITSAKRMPKIQLMPKIKHITPQTGTSVY